MIAETARAAINDCRICLEMMEEEEDGDRFRVLWIGGLAILRAVGKALQERDCRNEPEKTVLNQLWTRWKGEPIFAKFIERSRNLALKEYEVLAEEGTFGPLLIKSKGDTFAEIPEFLYRPISSGFGEGDDARDIYRDAIQWWEQKISELEGSFI